MSENLPKGAALVDNRPPLVRDSVKRTVNTEIEATLLKDFKRYSSGLISMTATSATFTHPETKEHGNVGVDLGGTKIEVTIGDRGWQVDIGAIVSAVMDLDKEYREANPLSEPANASK